MEGVGAEEEDVVEEGVRRDFEDVVWQRIFTGGGPFLDAGEDLL